MNKFKKTMIASAITLAGLSLNAATYAFELEEIVVTAQKRAQNTNDIGLTVNAFSGNSIRELGVASMTDMAEHVPGLIYSEAGGLGVPVYTIRGVGFDDYSPGSNSTVGVYVDQVALPYPVMTKGLVFDIERVEVLKGPQGDLYGRNTTGGAVNFINAKPTEAFEAGVTAEYAKYNQIRLESYVSGALSDTMRGRFAATTTQSSEGWMKSQTRDDELGEVDTSGFRALLDWDASESVSVLFNLHYNSDQSENAGNARSGRPGLTNDRFTGLDLTQLSGWVALPLAASGLPGNTGIAVADALAPAAPNKPNRGDWTPGTTPENDDEQFGGSVTIDWALESVIFTSISAYDKLDRNATFDWDGTALALLDQLSETTIESWSQELRLTSSGDGDLTWITGAYFSYDEIDDYFLIAGGDSGASAGLFINAQAFLEQETTTASLYGHLEWQLADAWRLTLGGRYTHEEREIAVCTADFENGIGFAFSSIDFIDFDLGGTGDDFFFSSTPIAEGGCITIDSSLASVIVDGNGPGTTIAFAGEAGMFEDETTVDNVSGKIGLDYVPNDDWLIYASIATGFKSGGYNGAASTSFVQHEPYEEEELLAFELGFKATLLDGSMQLNAATFYMDYQDKQVLSIIPDPFFGPLGALVNIPESTILGAEVEGQWVPTESLNIRFGLAYLETEVEKYSAIHPTSTTIGVVDFKGAELGSAPELTANLQASYDWNLANTLFVRLSGDMSYKDDYHSGLEVVNPKDDRFNVDSYVLANARLTLGQQDDSWDVSAWVRNLNDKYYYHSASLSADSITRAIGQGRSYGLTFNYRWQ